MGNSPIVARINSILAEKGISKQKFYEDCHITSASYSLWNTGKTSPRAKNLEIIADYLDVTVEYLQTGLGQKEKPAHGVDELDEVTKKLHKIIEESTEEERQDMLDYVEFMMTRRKNDRK